jgi:hypothetical protein
MTGSIGRGLGRRQQLFFLWNPPAAHASFAALNEGGLAKW